MESYISIAYLNDFVFCPRSIYYHHLYQSFHDLHYKSNFQIQGDISHTNINEQKYSSKKDILQAIYVYCEEYKLCGRIDIFDKKTKTLIERKHSVTKIYDGYVFQLYAQYFAMIEMGYEVEKLKVYDLSKNQSHFIKLPTDDPLMKNKFIDTVNKLRNYNLYIDNQTINEKKCLKCIYNRLCDKIC